MSQNRFTHLTMDGTPVLMINERYVDGGQDGVQGLVQTRTGTRQVYAMTELHPLGSAEARDILAEVAGAEEATAVEEALEDRVVLARWAKCLGNARDTLAQAISTVLGTSGVDGPGHGSRRVLERALVTASDDLADFSR